MTKVTCATLECKYNNDRNRCTAHEINLSDHSVMTVHDGRQRYNRCKMFEMSDEAKEIEERFRKMFDARF